MSHTYINFPSFWLHGWAWNCPVQEKGRSEGCEERTDSNELLPVHKCSLPRVPCARHQILPDGKPRVTSCRATPEKLWWMQTEWGQCPPSLHCICFLPFYPPSLPGSWGMCAVQDFWGDERHPGPSIDAWWQGTLNSCFESVFFFFFKSGTWEQEAYLEGGDKEERDEGWELTSRITPVLFPLPLPCPGLINTRRLIFGCGVRAGLELSPGALLNVINCECAVRGVCEWHLSLRPSSNIYTVEVQLFSF